MVVGSGGSGRELQACMAPHYPGQPGSPSERRLITPQNGGHGIDGHSPRGRGIRRRVSSRSARRTSAARSPARRAACRAGPAPRRGPCERLPAPVGELTTGPPPQQRAQLWIGMEADAVIDPEHLASAAEDVAAFAVGIVDQHVEDRQQPEISDIGVDHRHRTIIAIETFDRRRTSPAWATPARNQVDQLGAAPSHPPPPRPAATRVRTGHRRAPSPAHSRIRRSGTPRTRPPRAARGCGAGSPRAAAPPRIGL